jgi:hypothetical protein
MAADDAILSCGCCRGPAEDRCCCHIHQDIPRGLRAHKCSRHADDRARLIAALELKLEKARYGMGMPYCAEDVRHYEALLAQARRAQPDDPGVRLAAWCEGGAS